MDKLTKLQKDINKTIELIKGFSTHPDLKTQLVQLPPLTQKLNKLMSEYDTLLREETNALPF